MVEISPHRHAPRCVMTPLSIIRRVSESSAMTRFPRSPRPWLVASILAVTTAAVAVAGAVGVPAPTAFTPGQLEFFETSIRPVLAENCHECHTGRKAKNGLRLDSRAGILKGSDYRKVVNPEKPSASALLIAVKHAGASAKIEDMPKDGDKLSVEVIAHLEKWIAMGLPWPEEAGDHLTDGDHTDRENHWAFQPVMKPEIPKQHSGHPIDFFIDKKLAEAGLKAAPAADRATLYRRAHFDLLGLPPKFGESKKFIDDPRPDAEAWPALVDHLLGSPHFGERQARHWMDVARYSDTKGYEAGGRERRFVYSYTYRDWLIRSFNADLPYDQFLLYQLAAEQLVDQNKPHDLPNLAALGFLTLSKNGRIEDVIDDRIDTTFRGLQALTVGCARCHDHKSDPIATAEYYGMFGVFLNSVPPKELPVIGQPKTGPEYDAYLVNLAEKRKVVEDFLAPKLEQLAKQFPELANRRAALMGKLDRADRRKLQNLQKVVDKFVADAEMEPDKALILEDRPKAIPQPIFIRGDRTRRGEIAPRRFLAALAGPDAPEFQRGSGRLELARAIADPANPVTARVIVNRVWAWHFGEGLVRTVSDFGIEGAAPSHPELLDWLAAWFVENGWSLKKLHRLILTSEAWRRASVHPGSTQPGANFAAIDPENRLLWRHNRQRLDFEQMHDALLNVANNLGNDLYGRSVKLLTPPFTNRRAVYAYIDRQNIDPTFRIFDFANPQQHTGKRPRTSIPMQALFLMNNAFVQQQAKQLVARPEVKGAASPEAKIAALHRAVFARDADKADRETGARFIQRLSQSLAPLRARQTPTDWQYGYGAVDPETGAIDFHRLEHWDGDKWQARAEYPVKNNALGHLSARRDGSAHPGNDAGHALIMRWTAPRAMKVNVSGILSRHESVIGKGDGVIAKIVVSGQGMVLQRAVPPTATAQSMTTQNLALSAGDTIDFVVEPGAHASFDSYRWQPQLNDAADPGTKWNYTAQYSGPADLAGAWETYAQALLETNEFLFVD